MLLIADDAKDVRETTAEVLKVTGYDVLQAEDGLKALETFKAHQNDISLIILDIVMPGYSGDQVAKLIREINPNVPIVFMTGYDKEQVLGDCLEIQNSGILSKPVRFEVLIETIKNLNG